MSLTDRLAQARRQRGDAALAPVTSAGRHRSGSADPMAELKRAVHARTGEDPDGSRDPGGQHRRTAQRRDDRQRDQALRRRLAPRWMTITSVTSPPTMASGPMTRAGTPPLRTVPAVAPTSTAVNGASIET